MRSSHPSFSASVFQCFNKVFCGETIIFCIAYSADFVSFIHMFWPQLALARDPLNKTYAMSRSTNMYRSSYISNISYILKGVGRMWGGVLVGGVDLGTVDLKVHWKMFEPLRKWRKREKNNAIGNGLEV